MATQYAFGQIVTSGLVLALDAADRNSYVSGSTTWNDVSGNGNNGTLTNGPTFSNNSIVFDGVDDYCINSLSNGFTTAMTIITIAKSTNSTWNNYAGLGSARYNNGYIMHNNSGITTVTMYLMNSSADYTDVGTITPNNIQNFNIYVLTTNGSNSHKTYLNGVLAVSSNTAITRTNTGSSQSNYLGLDSTAGARYNAMSIASHLIYNRELSLTEIQQNYNTQKSRFNL